MMLTPRLLITDDDFAIRKAIEDVFRDKGLVVTTAGDGDEAISVIESGEVHLLLVDVHMPRVGGLEVMRHLQTRNRKMPCILMSAGLTESIEREAFEMHAYRVLRKPLRVSTLRETVMQGLREVYGWKAS